MIGNQLLQCSNNQNAACHNDNSNNGQTLYNVDVDEVGPSAAQANSSTADLDIPAGAEVVVARLYWAGRWNNTGNTANNRWNICFKAPGCSYQQLTAGANDRHVFRSVSNTSPNFPYTAAFDVTAQVQAAGSGTYSAGGLTTATTNGGGLGNYGGWAMIV